MIYNKDSRLLKQDVPANHLHAVVTDPPYGMNIMENDWDQILPPVEIWQACYESLRPGGFLLAFGHTRLYHQLACKIESCGFVIKDCLCWAYASGYPHSVNPGLLFDKNAGYDRTTYNDHGELTTPVTEDGKTWNGYGTVLKTAWEPIVLAQKPIEKNILNNVAKYKCGVLNIDACRVPYASDEDREKMKTFENFKGEDHGDSRYFSANEGGKKQANVHPLGRWPANLLWLDPLYADYDHIFMVPKPGKNQKRRYNQHDTVKPVELMERLISLVTPCPTTTRQDVYVLDPFMGSGTTGVACNRLGRKFIGYELSPEHFETAKHRIEEPSLVDLFG